MSLRYLCHELNEILETFKKKKLINDFLEIEENQEFFPDIYILNQQKAIILHKKISEIRKHIYNISPKFRQKCIIEDYEVDSVISILY